VTLLLVFILLAFVLTLFLWGGSMLLQGWLYQNPAEHMPLRSAISGTIMASFLTGWCFIDARSGGKYDTLFEFSPVEIIEVDSFTSLLKTAQDKELTVDYTKRIGTRGSSGDFFDPKGTPWAKNTSDTMVVAILVKEKDKAEPTRFNANLDAKGNFPRDKTEIRYTDASGRYMPVDSLGRIYRKKTGVLIANLLLNGVHFLLWWAVLWFGVRYTIWQACGLAFVIWMFMMVGVQPVLFNFTRG